VTTDNGPEVKGAFTELLDKLKVPQVRISSYNKRANGVVERGHFVLHEAIIRSSEKNKDRKATNWPEQIPVALFADRVTVSNVTGYTPFFLLHGVEPVLPFDIMEATFLSIGFHKNMTTAELLAARMRQLHRHEADLKQAAENLKAARFRSREQFIKRFEKKIKDLDIKEGSLVLKRDSALESTVNKFKRKSRYIGPYEVDRITKRRNCVLKELDGTVLAEAHPMHQLVPYIQRNSSLLEELSRDSDDEIQSIPSTETKDTTTTSSD